MEAIGDLSKNDLCGGMVVEATKNAANMDFFFPLQCICCFICIFQTSILYVTFNCAITFQLKFNSIAKCKRSPNFLAALVREIEFRKCCGKLFSSPHTLLSRI